MSFYRINGGKKLKGSIPTYTAKNSIVACLCASVLVKGTVTLKDVPRIQEVNRILELIESIGVKYEWKDERTLVLDSSGKIDLTKINKEASRRTRSSLLLLGSLAGRGVKNYKLYRSGGCKLGTRTVKPHLYALEKFGVSIVSRSGYYEVVNKKLKSADIVMYESGDTPTQNAILAAILAPGKTTIQFASANYMVQDLCFFLNTLGAKIKGIGTTTLEITGVKELKSGKSHHITPDPIDAMAWISLAATTKSDLTITGAPIDFLALELEKLRVMGQQFTIKNQRMSNSGKVKIVDIHMKGSDLTALPDKISCRPYPGFNIDNLPLFIPILTQAKGQSLVHDWVYENRVSYALELQRLGAKIRLIDTHRIFVDGKTKLKGNNLMSPPALRPAMAVLIAMLAAKGHSTLQHVYQVERGYGDLVPRLQAVGADIERVE